MEIKDKEKKETKNYVNFYQNLVSSIYGVTVR